MKRLLPPGVGLLFLCAAFTMDSLHAQAAQAESAEQLANETWGPAGGTPTARTGTAAAGSGQHQVFAAGAGVNGTIYAAVGLPDGSVVIGGEFNSVATQPRANVARILADGTLDASWFNGTTGGVNGTVFALAADANGGVLVGGYFSEAQEKPHQNLVRFDDQGNLDQSFGGTQQPIGPNGKVLAIAVLPNGRIVIGGEFSEVGTTQRLNVAMLNPDGTLADAGASASTVEGTVHALATTAAGSVLAGGLFNVADGGASNIAPISSER